MRPSHKGSQASGWAEAPASGSGWGVGEAGGQWECPMATPPSPAHLIPLFGHCPIIFPHTLLGGGGLHPSPLSSTDIVEPTAFCTESSSWRPPQGSGELLPLPQRCSALTRQLEGGSALHPEWEDLPPPPRALLEATAVDLEEEEVVLWGKCWRKLPDQAGRTLPTQRGKRRHQGGGGGGGCGVRQHLRQKKRSVEGSAHCCLRAWRWPSA